MHYVNTHFALTLHSYILFQIALIASMIAAMSIAKSYWLGGYVMRAVSYEVQRIVPDSRTISKVFFYRKHKLLCVRLVNFKTIEIPGVTQEMFEQVALAAQYENCDFADFLLIFAAETMLQRCVTTSPFGLSLHRLNNEGLGLSSNLDAVFPSKYRRRCKL